MARSCVPAMPAMLAMLAMQAAVAAGQDLASSAPRVHTTPRTHSPLEMSTEFFIVPRGTQLQPHNRTLGGAGGLAALGVLRPDGWVVPLLIAAALTMALIAAFEVFVLCKAWRTSPSRRHLFLGQMLLLGLFLCAGLGAVVAVSPTTASCATVRFGAGLALALVFSALLVKTVFLISLNSGVYLPAPYQALLLFFAVLIQLVVGVQWLVNSPPHVDLLRTPSDSASPSPPRRRLVVTADDLVDRGPHSVAVCHTPYTQLLTSLVYVVFLIVFVAVLAVKSRGIRDNYREATYIGLSVGCVVPVWLVWAVAGLVLAERHKDACVGFGLVATAAVVFLIMFMPKGRQLAAMGKDGLYVEDREDRFSSLTPAGSGYSPSFFHFKPVKYGVVGETPAPTSNTHKTNPSAATTLGDRVALVAAPPSYTRMYHYYPPAPAPYYPSYYPPRYPDMLVKSEEGNLYCSQEPTLSANPNVFFQRNTLHPGLMY